jgi:hypothetical protein
MRKNISSKNITKDTTLYPLAELEKKEHPVQKEVAQTHLGMEFCCCVSDIGKTRQPDTKIHFHETRPQSGFEIFCDQRGSDPLTLDKKGLQRIANEFAGFQNQIRRRIGARRISLSEVYKDVQDYIGDRKLSFCN